MPRLVVRLLGAPVIEFDGRPVELDTRKAVALLAYLALSGERQTRDALATLLWPEYDQTHSRAALRRTLSTLKKALGGHGLASERESLAVDPEADLWLDVHEFRGRLAEPRGHGHPAGQTCPACLAPLLAAVELYRGDFMAGFTLRDSAAFDEWQYFQSETLRRELAGALKGIIAVASAQRDDEQAIACARRWLALDPL